MTSSSAPIALFNFLDATHRNIQTHLETLRGLVDAVAQGGLTAEQRQQARVVIAYFNQEARHHHLDEEKHVFPSLLNSSDAALVATGQRLIQDHGWLEETWLEIEPLMEAVVHDNQWFDPIELSHAYEVFEGLYTDHIVLEEGLAFPGAQKQAMAWDAEGIGREMAKRRALKRAAAKATQPAA